MNNKCSIWCKISGVISLVLAVLCAITLILFPVAVYAYIGFKRYFEWSKLTSGQLTMYKDNLKNWAIFLSVCAFPFGLISIIPAVMVSNNVTVTNVGEDTESTTRTYTFAPNRKVEEVREEEEIEKVEDVISNKEEVIEKLDKLKAEGLITEEEYKRALKDL